jgi:hypothetical protein
MDTLSQFGLAAVTAMLIFSALEDRSPWYTVAFALACAPGSVYGFLRAAWPFGLVEAVWMAVAVNRWRCGCLALRGSLNVLTSRPIAAAI